MGPRKRPSPPRGGPAAQLIRLIPFPSAARSPTLRSMCWTPHGNPVPIGVPGELHIGGDCLARGYLNRPELTRQKFVPNPFSSQPRARLYKTGDLVHYLPEGALDIWAESMNR